MFFYHPMSKFGIRELGRETGFDTKTVMKYLQKLVARKVILRKDEKGHFPRFEANRLSQLYQFEKGHVLMKKIIESNVLDFLEKKCRPKAIVLFGSVRKGTYHEKSDIDLFIQAQYKRLDVSDFEKKIGHKISLLFEEDIRSLNKGLIENLYNGEVVSGKLEAV